jgi:hypothetical protein
MLIWHSFTSSPPLPLTYYLMQAQTSHSRLSGLFLSSSGSPSPFLLLAYQLMQAQMSCSCSSNLFLSSSILYSHIVGHTYPDELHELVWVRFSSTTAMESCKLRRAVAHLGLFGFSTSIVISIYVNLFLYLIII